jgi:hypothetical protein
MFYNIVASQDHILHRFRTGVNNIKLFHIITDSEPK